MPDRSTTRDNRDSAPAREPYMVHVLGFDVKTGEEVRRRTINIHDDEMRSWLFGKFIVWAVYSGVAVEIVAVRDEKAS